AATVGLNVLADETRLTLDGQLMGYSAFVRTDRSLSGVGCDNGLALSYAVPGGYMIDVVGQGELLDASSIVHLRFSGSGDINLESVDGRDMNNNAQSVSTTESGMGTLPTVYSLEQNYPNPFNPTTTLRFALPEAGQVELSVYNTLGQRVATVVNSSLQAGWHEVTFDGSSLASGVYYYRMLSGNFQDLKKMVLVK
ncbi:MAG: T9SS type A sorting domain-containing protein, partial [Candidatus Cloacimonetes bacterium]|nr:T9SS type A sorting domain-containing protein [Candidatus Cloacimonadota bacterium]